MQPSPHTAKVKLIAAMPEYAVVTDATTLARGAKATADALSIPTVALHPSNFTVQAGAVDGWLAKLESRRGAELAHALPSRSGRTDLGRFMTTYHCRPPVDLRPAPPVLTSKQRPFFAYTGEVSKIAELDGAPAQAAGPWPCSASSTTTPSASPMRPREINLQ